jgi:hypothetical protein
MDKPQKQGAKKTVVYVSSVSPMRNAMFQYTPCLDNQIELCKSTKFGWPQHENVAAPAGLPANLSVRNASFKSMSCRVHRWFHIISSRFLYKYIYIESPLKKKTIKTHINHDETAKSADFQWNWHASPGPPSPSPRSASPFLRGAIPLMWSPFESFAWMSSDGI